METILLFRTGKTEEQKIRRLAGAKKIRVIRAEAVDLDKPLAAYLQKGLPVSGETSDEKDVPSESLLVFCDLTQKHFDKMLFEIRQAGIHVDYKAVLTPVNRTWTVRKLYGELAREHREIQQQSSKNREDI